MRGVATVVVALLAIYVCLTNILPIVITSLLAIAANGNATWITLASTVALFAALAAIRFRREVAAWLVGESEPADPAAVRVAFIGVTVVGLLSLLSFCSRLLQITGLTLSFLPANRRYTAVWFFAGPIAELGVAALVSWFFLTRTGAIAREIAGSDSDESPSQSTMAIVFAAVGLYEIALGLPQLAGDVFRLVMPYRGMGQMAAASDVFRSFLMMAFGAVLVAYSRTFARLIDRRAR